MAEATEARAEMPEEEARTRMPQAEMPEAETQAEMPEAETRPPEAGPPEAPEEGARPRSAHSRPARVARRHALAAGCHRPAASHRIAGRTSRRWLGHRLGNSSSRASVLAGQGSCRPFGATNPSVILPQTWHATSAARAAGTTAHVVFGGSGLRRWPARGTGRWSSGQVSKYETDFRCWALAGVLCAEGVSQRSDSVG